MVSFWARRLDSEYLKDEFSLENNVEENDFIKLKKNSPNFLALQIENN